ncbi:MAG: serpin family protein [Deltaproteobacteria bacterium]|nr:serpin family protein [Deltaproteobacteria bacterium]
MRAFFLVALLSTTFLFGSRAFAQNDAPGGSGGNAEPLFTPEKSAEAMTAEENGELPPPSPAAKARAEADNLFALDLFGALGAEEDGNIFFSPISVSEAMGMAYAGASSDTRTQMAKVLRFGDGVPGVMGELNDRLEKSSGDTPGIVLTLDSSLWMDKDGEFLESYLKTLGAAFDNSVREADFKNDGEAARLAVNDWASEATDGKITEILPTPLTPLTRLILVNAVLFKGNWLLAFDPDLSAEGDFNLGKDSKVKTIFMNKNGKLPFYEKDGLKAVSVPYAGEKFFFSAILPPEGDGGFANPEKHLTPELLRALTAGFEARETVLSIPRFAFGWGVKPLKETFRKLGLDLPFGEEADFSGITGDKTLSIAEVYHRAYVDVNEAGTEAAAASSVQFVTRSMRDPEPPRIFQADRPFVFLIWEKDTGSVLFAGRFSKPAN